MRNCFRHSPTAGNLPHGPMRSRPQADHSTEQEFQRQRLRREESAALRADHQSNALADSGCMRSRLVTVRRICTRNRVLCLVALGVSISIPVILYREHTSA